MAACPSGEFGNEKSKNENTSSAHVLTTQHQNASPPQRKNKLNAPPPYQEPLPLAPLAPLPVPDLALPLGAAQTPNSIYKQPSHLNVDALLEVVEQHSGIPLNHLHHVAFGEKLLQLAKLGGHRGLDVGKEQIRLAVYDLSKGRPGNTAPMGGGVGCSTLMPNRSKVTINSRIPTMPGRSTVVTPNRDTSKVCGGGGAVPRKTSVNYMNECG